VADQGYVGKMVLRRLRWR